MRSLFLSRILSIYKYWEMRGDEELAKYGYKSRTLSYENGDFRQLPSVFRFDKEAVPNTNDWRVDESWLEQDYYRINNYDGDGTHRCAYLFADNTALYNNQGFPKRQYLTMSTNILREIEWVTASGVRYLKFKTLKPGDVATEMTNLNHPEFVHRFDLVGHNNNETYHTYNTPRGEVFFFLTSREGYGYIPEEFVKRA